MDENSMFLTPAETREMTGYRSRACQIRWCSQNGILFRQRSDGSLVILRQHVHQVFGGLTEPEPDSVRPDFSSLK